MTNSLGRIKSVTSISHGMSPEFVFIMDVQVVNQNSLRSNSLSAGKRGQHTKCFARFSEWDGVTVAEFEPNAQQLSCQVRPKLSFPGLARCPWTPSSNTHVMQLATRKSCAACLDFLLFPMAGAGNCKVCTHQACVSKSPG